MPVVLIFVRSDKEYLLLPLGLVVFSTGSGTTVVYTTVGVDSFLLDVNSRNVGI